MNRSTELEKEWTEHWKKINKKESFFGRILNWYRYNIIANAVKYYFDRYFPKKGTYIEMGSGTSQTSIKIIKRQRKLIAFDISKPALEEAKKIPQIDSVILGDIFKTKLKSNSVDGIWNLGVMEHFTEKEIIKILNEFERVSKPGAHMILFWPPKFGSSELVLGFFEFFINIKNKITGKKPFHFFPGEITRLKSKAHARRIIEKTSLKFVDAHFNARDGFTHIVVICKKEK
jgi:SAM-dependent methyltransferase